MRLYEQDVNRTFYWEPHGKEKNWMCLGIMTVPIINKVILGWVAFGGICCGRWVYCIYQFDWNCNKAGRTHENGRRNPDLRK